MDSERGFFAELMQRRVPQYLGVYIAGVWLGIEIGDWLSEQFSLPERLTAYIFVFLAVLLPSVALVAWNHGAPGKDRSPTTERVFVPLNVMLALSALLLVPADKTAPPAETVAAAPADAAAEIVADLGISQRMIAFFWRNRTAEASDWYGYAVPFMIGEDMVRAWSGFVVSTPFRGAGAILEDLRRAGFERALNEPQALQLQLARERQFRYALRGEIADADTGGLLMRYTLHDVQTGNVLASGSEPFDDDSLLLAIDKVSTEVQRTILSGLEVQPTVADLPMSESMSDSVAAIRLYTEARIADDIDRDNEAIAPLLRAAIDADAQFAEAHAALGLFHYLNGNNTLAMGSFEEALRYEYRLSRESVFNLRINRLVIEGKVEEAAEVARFWTQAEPNNETALQTFANLNVFASIDLDGALQALEAVRKINPTALETLRQSASIEQQRGNLAAASDYLDRYVAARPDSISGAVQLARLTLAAGDFDTAFTAFQQASYLDSKSLAPELGMIEVLVRRGDFARAEDRLGQLEKRELTEQQRIELFGSAVTVYTLSGQYRELLAAFERVDAVLKRQVPPVAYTLQFKAARLQYESLIDDDVEARIAALERLREELEPPWTEVTYLFDAGIYAIYDMPERYVEAQSKADVFLSAQTNNNSRLLMFQARAQAALYEDNVAAALENIGLALDQTRESVFNLAAASELFLIRAELYELLRLAGEPRRAIEGLLEVLQQFPGLAMGHFRLAQAYADIGNEDAARRAVDQALSLWRNADPELIYVRQANALQARLQGRV